MSRGGARGARGRRPPRNQHVTVVGCDGRPFGPEATAALAAAERVIGAPRHLRQAPVPAGAERIELKHLDEALDALGQDQSRTAVLASRWPS